MEDVLDLYAEPYDPKRPVVNFDETSKQLVAEKKTPIPPRRGRRERFDYEYKRNGTRNLFMCCEPLAGWRHVAVTERRTMVDFAHQMRWLVDEAYAEAEKIRVVLDNPNIHKPASLYQAFRPDEARRIRKRLEFHYTPKHGSWLNMAEIEFSVFSRQCLARRPDSIGEDTLKREIAALEAQRNNAQATIDWRFSTVDARVKLSLSVSIPQFQLDEVLAGMAGTWAYLLFSPCSARGTSAGKSFITRKTRVPTRRFWRWGTLPAHLLFCRRGWRLSRWR